MANLIPPHAKRGVIVEYWIRVISVWFILLGLLALFVGVLNLSSYLLIKNQQSIYQDTFADANDKTDTFTAIEHEVIKANETARLLATIEGRTQLHTYILRIESLANDQVVIDKFDFALSAGVPKEITIAGVAEDRESLVGLSDTIEADSYFVSADIPLSNLAKDKDIPFRIKVILADQSGT